MGRNCNSWSLEGWEERRKALGAVTTRLVNRTCLSAPRALPLKATTLESVAAQASRQLIPTRLLLRASSMALEMDYTDTASLEASAVLAGLFNVDPGETLVNVAAKRARGGQRELFDYERELLEHCFAYRKASPTFQKTYIKAVRLATQNRSRELLDFLLQHDETGTLLRAESDILQTAIKAYISRYTITSTELESLVQTVQLLSRHGAPLNTRDVEGNTPLYYTCVLGRFEPFKALVDANADYTVLHQPIHETNVDGLTVPDSGQPKSPVNLVQITLGTWTKQLHSPWDVYAIPERWANIAIYLLDEGLECDKDDPALRLLLHVAAYQGNISTLQKLIGYGVDVNCGAVVISSKYAYTSGSALHVAAINGQRESALALILYGADVRSKKPHRTALEQSTPRPIHPISPIAAALHSVVGNTRDLPSIHETCELILEAGASEDDGTELLKASAVSPGLREVAIVARLLAMGVRMERLSSPHRAHSESIQLLLKHGCRYDVKVLQKYAISRESVELLRFLVQKDGRQLSDEEVGRAGSFYIQEKRQNKESLLAMMRYLVEDYIVDINHPFKKYSRSSEIPSYLLRSCTAHDTPSALYLLNVGTEVQRTEHLQSAFESIRATCNRSSLIGFVPLLRAIVSHAYGDRNMKENVSELVKNSLQSHLPDDLEAYRLSIAQLPDVSDNMMRQDLSSFAAFNPGFYPRELEHGDSEKDLSLTPTIYQSLPGVHMVRLLKLETSPESHESLRFSFSIVPLSSHTPFAVLSSFYENTPKKVQIWVDDKAFNISVGLWMALKRLHAKMQLRLLWTREICINHADTSEKSKQLSMLSDICSTATELIVNLGEEAGDSKLFSETTDCHPQSRARVYERGQDGEEVFDDHGDRLSRHVHVDGVKLAFVKLIHKPPACFFQPWTILELRSCKRATALRGEFTEDLFTVFQMRGYWRTKGLRPLIAGVHSRFDAWRELPGILIDEPCPDIADPREGIFGLIGIFNQQLAKVDYSLDVATVYRQFTQNLFTRSMGHSMLHCFGATPKQIPGLPSWVPDYSISRIFGKFGGALSHSDLQKYMIPPQFPDDHTLVLHGLHVDTITDVSSTMPEAPFNQHLDAFTQALHSFETVAVRLGETKDYALSIPDVFCMTLIALVGVDEGFHKYGMASSAFDFAEWYKRYGAGVLSAAYPHYFRELDAIRAFLGEQREGRYKIDVEGAIGRFGTGAIGGGFCWHVESKSAGRRMVATEKGVLGLAGFDVLVGDRVVYFPNSAYLLVLRKRVEEKTGEIFWEMHGDCYLYGFDERELLESGQEMAEFKIR
ncbi:hypothetical protein BDV95DRAFT_593188 [Massariosphaeria phaeospora]|uniref:Heterokaryon incompatibility domain-containing protein n=1 Tax=Massariosphaeria phaeospora TaxID=100035 RepID=A0A7C8IDZ2_9PLEO|nr:hypothetical protein BDV95DRAFT_593188 [Massariosphaeria phaeospora]